MGVITASSSSSPPPEFARPPRALLWRRAAAYLTASETHTYAFSIAAQALLSFFPFIVLLLSVARNVLHDERLYRGLLTLVGAYLPVADTPLDPTRTYVLRHLGAVAATHQRAQIFSLLILLATCTGIFLPLEVALNRVWGAPRNRGYLRNWLLALGLAAACGVLGLLSASFTALSESYSSRLARFLWRNSAWVRAAFGAGGRSDALHQLVASISVLVVHLGAVPVTIAVFFLVYWRLPNCRVPARQVLPAAVAAGVAWEVSKYLYIVMLPWISFREIYGPFALSVALVLWAYVSALLLLGGAEWVAEQRRIAVERAAAATD